jgi:branched-chain amino acid aminotransferase
MNDCTGKYYLINEDFKYTDETIHNGLQHGISIYELLQVKNFVALFLEDHLERLFQSLKLENLWIKETYKDIEDRIYGLIRKNSVQSGKIRLEIHFSNYSPLNDYNVYLFTIPHNPPADHQYQYGVSTIFCRAVRKDPNVKIMNTEARKLADKRIGETEAYEAILLDNGGYITEGSRSNLFFVKGNTLITPPDDTVLQGITRKKILEICRKDNIDTRTQMIHQKEISQFDAAFLSGTTPKVLPIQRIEEFVFQVENPLIKFIINAYNDMVEKYVEERK